MNRIILTYKKIDVKKVKKSTCLKWTCGHFGNDYRVATLTTTGIKMQIDRTILMCLN